MICWRIYYDDLPPFDNSTGPPEDSPALGVQVIVQPHAQAGRELLRLSDYYWWEAGRWWRGDIFGLWDYLQRPGWKVVRFGRTIETERHEAIYQMAKADPDFPPKSARLPGEPIR